MSTMAVAKNSNEGTTWLDRHKAELFKIVKRNARLNVPIEQSWIEASKRLGRKSSACEVAFNRFAPSSIKHTVDRNYDLHRRGLYKRPIDIIREKYATQLDEENPKQEESVPAPKEILESIEKVNPSVIHLPLVSESNVEITPLLKALAYIVAQVGSMESQVTYYKKLAKVRKEEISKLNMDNEGLRSELKKTKNRLAQVVKK